MSETVTSLGTIDGFDVQQVDFVSDQQDLSTIQARSSETPFEMDVEFGDLMNEESSPPYEILRWPTLLKDGDVVAVVKDFGNQYGGEKYVCIKFGDPDSDDKGESQEATSLDEALSFPFDLLRVDCRELSLAFEVDTFYEGDQPGDPIFGVMGAELLDPQELRALIAKTVREDLVSASGVALNSLNAIFEKYGTATAIITTKQNQAE